MLAGQLSGDEQQAVMNHVEMCPRCQATLEQLTACDDLVPTDGLRSSDFDGQGIAGCADVKGAVGRQPSLVSMLRLGGDATGPGRTLPASSGTEDSDPQADDQCWPQIPGFQILEELGRGGMGIVYLARHQALDRLVALKMILAGEQASPEQLVRFRLEGEMIARLRHPNIVQIHELGTVGRRPYCVLEYVEEGSLERRLAGRPWPARRAAELVETLAHAAHYAHQQGVIHRDLKPGNVLLAPDPASVIRAPQTRTRNQPELPRWVAKITDFGLARPLGSGWKLTQTGAILGTPSYMAPEQVRGRVSEIGPLTDVYALGAILYEVVGGRPPFQAPTTLEVMNQVAELEPVPLSRLLPGVPRDLEVICLKCLEKDPARRYPSAWALADDLRRFLDGRPIQARRVATFERAWRWSNRRPAVAGLLAGVVLALVGGTAVSSYFAMKANRRARDAELAGQEKQRALDIAQEARRQSDLRAAESRFRVGLDQCESGAVDRGLFTMLEAWRTAPPDAGAFRLGVRTNLAAWSRQLPILEHLLQHPWGGYALTRFVGPDGRLLIAWDMPNGQNVVAWDPATGQPVGPPFRAPAKEEVVDVNPDGTAVSTEAGGRGRVRERLTGRLVGSDFEHRLPGRAPSTSFALFCGPGDLMVTKSLELGTPQWFRQFWRLPVPFGTAGPVARLASLQLEPRGTYHVTSAAGGAPVAVVFPPLIATPPGGAPPQAVFWDLTSSQRIPALPTSLGRTDPRISWDGQTILSINSPEFWGYHPEPDGAVRWWQTATGRMVGEPWRPRRTAQYATLAADGLTLITRGEDHRVRLFDLASGHQRGGDILTTAFPERDFAPRVGATPDGSLLATGSVGGAVRLWQTRDFLPQNTLAANPRAPAPVPHRPLFDAGFISPDGRTGVVVSASSGVGRLVAASGEVDAAPLRQTHLLHCAFSPDGSLIATAPNNHRLGGKAVVTIRDRNGQPRGSPLEQFRYIHSLAFSPDGRVLAVGCVGGIFLWDVPTSRLRHFLREPTTAARLIFSPDGTRLAAVYVNGWAGVGAGVRLWDVNAGTPVGGFLAGKHPSSIRPYFVLAFAGDGETLRVFDLLTGSLHTLDARIGSARHDPAVLSPADQAVFGAGGAVLATAHPNASVQQWDAATGRRAGALLEMPQPVARLGYSPNGRVLAVACRDRSIRLWDASSCSPLGPLLLHEAELLDLRFTPDGASLAILMTAGRIRAWPLPQPVADDPERFELWLRARGGIGLENNSIVLLDAGTWRECRDRLQERWPDPDAALSRPPDEADWHDARARDAEEVGNFLAALWHLDRLIRLRPTDWHPLARKGLLYATAREFDLAESAYRLAAANARAAAMQIWHRQNAATCLVQGEWGTALRHLDWLVAAGGEDWQVHADRATAYGHLGRHREHEAARARAIELGADAAFLVPLAEEKAAQGQWSLARALFARAADRGGLDLEDACHHALCCLKAGDEDGYRRICASLTHDLRTGGPMSAVCLKGDIVNILTLLRVCLLRADATPDWQPLLKVSEDVLAVLMRGTSLAPENQPVNAPLDWLTARGAVLCRQGGYADAITSLGQCVNQGKNPLQYVARVFLAFSHLRLGQEGEAKRWMNEVHAPAADAQFSWEALEIELLRPMVKALQKEIGAPKK
jgi:serine/threonine protein kinase/WD40 repeat protein